MVIGLFLRRACLPVVRGTSALAKRAYRGCHIAPSIETKARESALAKRAYRGCYMAPSIETKARVQARLESAPTAGAGPFDRNQSQGQAQSTF